jgi:hypothetical protein
MYVRIRFRMWPAYFRIHLRMATDWWNNNTDIRICFLKLWSYCLWNTTFHLTWFSKKIRCNNSVSVPLPAANRLPKWWVRIPPGAWMFVCSERCVLWGRGLCCELITRPEKFCRLWCVVVCDLETWWIKRLWPTGGSCIKNISLMSLGTLSWIEFHFF